LKRNTPRISFQAIATLRLPVNGLTRIQIGDCTVLPALNVLERDGASVKLEPRAMDLLVYLANARDRVVPPDELLREVWQGRVFDDGIVYKKINQLRKALGDDSQDARFIETIPKRGYRLVAAVIVAEDEPMWAQAERREVATTTVAERAPDHASKRLWHGTRVASLSQPERAAQPAGRPRTAPRWLWPAAAAIAAVAVALAIAVIVGPRPASVVASDALRFDVAPGTGRAGYLFVRISPDGRRVAFGATRQGGSSEIWVRSLETQQTWPLGATFAPENGRPFWSADSRYIIFSEQGKLRRVDASGGPSQLLGDVQTEVFGGFTTEDGRLVYSEFGGGAWETSLSGGTPRPLDLGPDSVTALTPSALPNGSIVYCQCVNTDEFGIYVATPGAGPPRRLLPDRSAVQYAPSPDPELGYLLFTRGAQSIVTNATLMAQAIHPRELRLIGDPVAIAENVRGFSASNTGVLVYSADGTESFFPGMPGFVQGQLTWFDREGRILSTVGEPGIYRELALSPDQQHVAVTRADPATRGIHIYLFELARGVSNRFTFAAAGHTSPVWAPDGASVIFARWASGTPVEWYRRTVNLAGGEELLFQPLGTFVPTAISPDGRFALFYGPTGLGDIKAVDLARVAEARDAISLVSSDFHELSARFSPDGRWFAYASNESGTHEIYVRPFSPEATSGARSAGGRVMASKGGATFGGAIWRGDGRELFYLSPDGALMAVAVSTEPTFSVGGVPQALFKLPATDVFFAVSRDGERFLFTVPDGARPSEPPYRVILNWTSTLK
jgi:DNA-binding winged helix-turn-helix (wHTH) protein/Tol biopolymer transport system component